MADKIIALHGFLGKPVDFKPLNLDNLIAPHIFLTPTESLSMWAKRFNQTVKRGSILLGYSMGARLALHCLIDDPTLFKAAIIMAAHPGIKNPHERNLRLYSDYVWAEHFLRAPWAELLSAWNSSKALKSSPPLMREEHDFHRPSLRGSLRSFSLGHQCYLPPAINELSLPILWLFAAEESTKCADVFLKHKKSRKIAMEKGGHRFMFESPLLINYKIQKFLTQF